MVDPSLGRGDSFYFSKKQLPPSLPIVPLNLSMIISASRRTDIPAFYPDWFFNSLERGAFLARNPHNPGHISAIEANPQTIDAFVFWTKNPAPMAPRLAEIAAYPYYFLYTITAYGKTLEPGVPTPNTSIETFAALSSHIGRERLIWRYDPILITQRLTPAYHREAFKRLAARLAPHTKKCIVSFFSPYRKSLYHMKGLEVAQPTPAQGANLLDELAKIAAAHGLALEHCCPDSPTPLRAASCVDTALLSQIGGSHITAPRHRGQRPGCACRRSVDIGAYSTCPHACLYCYANASPAIARRNHAAHDPASPLLIGSPPEGEPIQIAAGRQDKTLAQNSPGLFDNIE